MFNKITATIQTLKTGDDDLGERAREIKREARRTIRLECQSLKLALELHTKAEEENLWPLFRTHFSEAEQIDIVGRIVGRTGAEAMKELLPFVTKALTLEERVSMFDSMRSAAQNTSFHEWLSQQDQLGEPHQHHHHHNDNDDEEEKEEGEEEKEEQGGDEHSRAPGDGNRIKPNYRPGWNNLFRFYRTQLEEAMINPGSAENASTETQRQDYLVRRLMTSQWILDYTTSAGKRDCHAASSNGLELSSFNAFLE